MSNAALRQRITELESALRLHLAVSPDDPLLLTPVEQEVVRVREQLAAVTEHLEAQRLATYQAVEREHRAKKRLQAVEGALIQMTDVVCIHSSDQRDEAVVHMVVSIAQAVLRGTEGGEVA